MGRSLSQIRPRAYLEEHFLSSSEIDAMHKHPGFKPTDKAVTFDKAKIDEDEGLKMLCEKVHMFARLPSSDTTYTLKISNLKPGEHSEVDSKEDLIQPAVKVFIYLPQRLEDGTKRGGEFILPAADPSYGTGQEAVARCKADFNDCCKKNNFKLEPHSGDAVL